MKKTVHEAITLNTTESNISNLLVEFCDFYNSQHPLSEQLVLRITGGWVRDKLLGLESNDIDIAINHLSGEDFASQLYDYLDKKQNTTQLRAIHTIKKNPEKSKHLETCTTKIYGLDIDFVNLRSEEYTSTSRVPIIKYGTAEEDAARRDATLNALFYNLNEQKIEDFTGRGMADLKAGILRTPLPPMQTFLDDPLRALRLIRFASRLDYEIEDNTLAAMATPELKSTLVHKISRERVGIELEKTLASGNPAYGLRLINHVGLADSIYNFGTLHDSVRNLNGPETVTAIDHATNALTENIHRATFVYPMFSQIVAGHVGRVSQAYCTVGESVDLRKGFWNSVVLSPYGELSVQISAKKNAAMHVPEVLMREGLKASKSEIDKVSVLTKNRLASVDLLARFFEDPSSVKRSELGLWLRNYGAFSALAIVYNCFYDIVGSVGEVPHAQTKPLPQLSYDRHHQTQLREVIESHVAKYEKLFAAIAEWGLVDVHLLKPIVDGKTLSKELQVKPGPWMGRVNSSLLVWQLDNPDKGKAECLEYARTILESEN